MDIPDAVVGKFILISTATLFILTTLWINTYPFLDEDSAVYELIPNPKWFLLFCAVWGLFFIGGLMSFTLYHIYPYL